MRVLVDQIEVTEYRLSLSSEAYMPGQGIEGWSLVADLPTVIAADTPVVIRLEFSPDCIVLGEALVAQVSSGSVRGSSMKGDPPVFCHNFRAASAFNPAPVVAS